MKKPDPEIFAEHVLWYLCGIQAQLREIDTRTATDLALRTKTDLKEMLTQSKTRREKFQKELFEDALRQCKLGQAPRNPPDDPPETPRNPRA
jgi:hypothetical protein